MGARHKVPRRSAYHAAAKQQNVTLRATLCAAQRPDVLKSERQFAAIGNGGVAQNRIHPLRIALGGEITQKRRQPIAEMLARLARKLRRQVVNAHDQHLSARRPLIVDLVRGRLRHGIVHHEGPVDGRALAHKAKRALQPRADRTSASARPITLPAARSQSAAPRRRRTSGSAEMSATASNRERPSASIRDN